MTKDNHKNSKKILMRTLFVIAHIIAGVGLLHAQVAVMSGNALCGSTATTTCKLTDLKALIKGVGYLIIGIGLPLIIVLSSVRILIAWKSAAEGNANAYKEAVKKIWNSLVGVFIIVLLLSGGLAMLFSFVSASDAFSKLFNLSIEAFVPHVYAQELPSPFTKDVTLMTFLLDIFRLVMRFFVYPLLIAFWAWTGFAFVLAQGKPEMLSKAKTLLIRITISTVVIVMLQIFLIAVQGTVEQILPGSTKAIKESGEVTAKNMTPKKEACIINGYLGTKLGNAGCIQATADNVSVSGYCNGKVTGTLCIIPSSSSVGSCKRDGVVACLPLVSGESCVFPGGGIGTVNDAQVCVGN